MTSRRGRLNLSLIRQPVDSPKSPIKNNPNSKTGESNYIMESSCSTPLNTRKRSTKTNDGSPLAHDSECSPAFLLSQDTSNVVSGVSWAWNSPKRASLVESKSIRPRPLMMQNNATSTYEAEFSRAQKKKITERLKGFNKFQTELKIMQESEMKTHMNVNNPIEDCSSIVIHRPHAKNCSEEQNIFVSFSKSIADCNKVKLSTFENEENVSNDTLVPKFDDSLKSVKMDSFNDSDLDIMLLESIEKQSALKVEKVPKGKPEKRKSLIKSRTMDDVGRLNDVTLNDSDFDSLLIEASQMAEVAVTVNCNEDSENTCRNNSKKATSLIRHKSMPESPSHIKVHVSAKTLEHNYLDIPRIAKLGEVPCSSNSLETAPDSSDRQPQTEKRKCTKEEIEQKRQEALKRQQARRLKIQMQEEISQSEDTDTTGIQK
ncbi:uncharacterized protein LOC129739005 isoform X3 [Uranotaenia lowii]|uniref:uncharacterized protein LOC129739005 isoform X3 n=1 Tax=Uranotaenia lowii TaxID=190385 RepID=UPI002478B1A8|nr:uncharacterized protein LOC129739005 isoform X3 [Uranotaenia lowii]